MGQAIGGILPFAVAATLSPLPITAVILILLSGGARVSGLTFAGGRVLGYALVIAIVILAAGAIRQPHGRIPSVSVPIVRLVVGVAALCLGIWTWVGRRKSRPAQAAPRWTRVVQGITPVKSAGVGFALSIGPKSILLLAGGGLVIANAPTGVIGGAAAAGIFLAVASATVIAPVVLYYALGDRGPTLLAGIQAWMSAHTAAIGGALLIVIGAFLTIGAIRNLQ